MAKAKQLPSPQPDIELVLTAKEASRLLTLLNAIGGNPSTTIRRETDAIRIALDNGGVKPEGSLTQSFYL